MICNRCGQSFQAGNIYCVEEGELAVQAFDCPLCGQAYQVLTTDRKMRELIERRKAVRQAIRVARAKKFSEKTFRRYERELQKIKREQEVMLPKLKKMGDTILHKREEMRGQQ